MLVHSRTELPYILKECVANPCGVMSGMDLQQLHDPFVTILLSRSVSGFRHTVRNEEHDIAGLELHSAVLEFVREDPRIIQSEAESTGQDTSSTSALAA